MVVCVVASAGQVGAQTNASAQSSPPRTRYSIALKLDFDGRAYAGTQRVRWVNRDGRPTNVLFFHLYANHRPPAEEGVR
ncbi:MAG TPA: hypothetical protein VGV38_00605, partial [Pyrinomonadaceae bacterium]|nr:hypothetical protein [Pyrinomonadaceae bacterium]